LPRAADFTTYFTVKPDPGASRVFGDLVSEAKKSYGAVAAEAAKASAASSRMVSGISGNVGQISGITGALRAQAAEVRALGQAHAQAARPMPQMTANTKALGTAAVTTAGQAQFLSRSLRTTAEALSVVQGPLGPLAGRLSAAGKALVSLTGVQSGAGAVAALGFVVARVGNEYQTLQARLRAYFPEQKQVNGAMADIIHISRDSRTSLEATAALYTRLSQSASQFHLTQVDVAKITRTATQAAVLSGSPSQTQAAGLYELSAALESGRLQGRQLRALLIDLPQLGQAIARGLGVTIGQLHEMGTKGVLTTESIAHALENASASVNTQFQRMPVTLGQATVAFKNAFTVAIGQMDQALGLSSNLGKAILAVADNLHAVLSVAAGVGVAFAALKTTGWVAGISAAVKEAQGFQRVTSAIAIATQAQVQANAELAASEVERANAAAIAAEREIARLETEIALTAELRNQQLAMLAGGPLSGVPGAAAFNASSYRAAMAAEAEGQQTLAILTQDLSRAKLAQVEATVAQTAATEANVAAQTEMNVVMATGVSSTGIFSTALRGLLSTGNLVAIAVTALAAGLIYYATSESAAQRATEAARQALSDYSDVVDSTTGKVKALTEAEGARAAQKARDVISKYEAGEGQDLRSQLAHSLLDQSRSAAAAKLGGTPALAARLQPFAQGLQSEATFDKTYTDLTRLSRGNDQFGQLLRGWLQQTDDLQSGLADLGHAAKAAKVELSVLAGGTDPAILERRAQLDAERRSHAKSVIEEQRDEIANANTLNDNALYHRNLKQTYKAFAEVGVLSPEEIAARRATIDALKTAPVAPGQEVERRRAIRQQNEDLQEAIRISNQYKGTIEELARAHTKADTAQRDSNRQTHQENQDERKALLQAKANAAAQLDAQLLALEHNRQSMTPEAYHTAEVALLKTYDDQISALDQRANASDRATTRAIENARRENEAYDRFDQQRQNILGRYTDEPKPMQRAERDVRQLTSAHAQLGENLYSGAQLQQDIAIIRDGLERPYREYLRDQQQSYQVQLLQIQGRGEEAAALQRAFQLQNQIGGMDEAHYQTILAQTQRETQINDILASRQRIYGLIQGVADETRQELITFLTDLPAKGAKAGSDLLKSVAANFNRIQITSFVENITGGLDERMRALISGRGAVDSASHYFAAQINSTSEVLATSSTSVQSLGAAAESTASTMLSAAQDFASGLTDTMTSFRAGIATTGAAAVETQTAKWPLHVPSRLTSALGGRTNPFSGKFENHPGLDLAAPLGTAVFAALGGKVVPNSHGAGFGNAVQIDVGHGLQNLYGHLSSIDVHLGQVVRQGQKIGEVGSTGRSTGNHLHYGAYQDGRAVDPRGVSALVSLGGGGPAGGGLGQAVSGLSSNLASLEETVGSLFDNTPEGAMGRLTSGIGEIGSTGVNQSELARIAQVSPNALQQLGGFGRPPTAKDAYNAMGGAVGDKLDHLLGTKFLGGIGKQFGTALEGAGQGAIASGFAKALGIKQSQMGAQLGGAIGSFLPIPGGAIIGGLIGGTLGGLLKKPKAAAATLTTDQFGNATVGAAHGNDATSKQNAGAIGSNVGNALSSIAQALGGQLVGGLSVSLGYRASDKVQPYRVDPTGAGRSTGNGVLAFGTQEEAIAAAVSAMLQKGVIAGISDASKRILEEGKDLQTEINKAVAIESIPKQLKAITDPVGAALDTLNQQFVTLISYLKEGGATAQQFADAQKLYEYQRSQAITAAQQQATGVISDLLTQLTATTNSPLNKRTVFENAESKFDPLKSDVLAGKMVDAGALATAAQNFEQASQALNGSDSNFFSDFNTVVDTLTRAKANAGGALGDPATRTDLPASPFETDTAVKDAIASLTGATDNQTDVIGGKLDTLIGIFQGGGGGLTAPSPSTLALLPSFGGGGISQRVVMDRV
jgi:tape measure domain-containing protein